MDRAKLIEAAEQGALNAVSFHSDPVELIRDQVKAAIAAYEAELARQDFVVEQGWQPVETAPTRKLVQADFGDVMRTDEVEGPEIWSAWQDEFGQWYGDHHSSMTATEKPNPPRRWRPLPAILPSPQGETDDG